MVPIEASASDGRSARDELHLCEGAAYNRIHAAPTARKFPLVLERLADSSLRLTAVRLLTPRLTDPNCERVGVPLARASPRLSGAGRYAA